MTDVAFVFPGQGSQKVGMGKALVDAYPIARQVFEEADEVLGYSLSKLCFEGPEDELALTEHTQPAVLTCSTAALRVLQAETGLVPTVALGHSLGEFSALVAAGALAFADAVKLVHLRGRAMQEAVAPGEGTMAAIMGIEPAKLETLCAEVSQGEVVAPANENGGGQIVVAGHQAAVNRLRERVLEEGGKAIMLKVSAPFHCALMEPAAQRLAQALEAVTVAPLVFPVVTNVTAEPNTDPARVRELLVRQVTQRVRWEASVRCVAAMGVREAYEIGHGKVLAGLIRRISPTIQVRAVGSPADVDVLKGGHVDG